MGNCFSVSRSHIDEGIPPGDHSGQATFANRTAVSKAVALSTPILESTTGAHRPAHSSAAPSQEGHNEIRIATHSSGGVLTTANDPKPTMQLTKTESNPPSPEDKANGTTTQDASSAALQAATMINGTLTAEMCHSARPHKSVPTHIDETRGSKGTQPAIVSSLATTAPATIKANIVA